MNSTYLIIGAIAFVVIVKTVRIWLNKIRHSNHERIRRSMDALNFAANERLQIESMLQENKPVDNWMIERLHELDDHVKRGKG